MALDTTRLGRLLPCCGHSTGRHIRLDPDDAKSVICLTGRCKVHMPKVKPQGRARRGKPKL